MQLRLKVKVSYERCIYSNIRSRPGPNGLGYSFNVNAYRGKGVVSCTCIITALLCFMAGLRQLFVVVRCSWLKPVPYGCISRMV